MTEQSNGSIHEGRLDLIRQEFAALADPRVVQKYARFFREGYDAYGIDRQLFEEKIEAWFVLFSQELDLNGFLDLGDQLLVNGKFEEGSLALGFVRRLRPQWDRQVFDRLGLWLDEGIRNWAHSDSLCLDILSPLLVTGAVPLAEMGPWREAPARFKRRAVPVSMLGLLPIRDGYAELFDFLRPIILDRERVVHQGLGWFLREAWKLRPAETEAFLMEYRDTAPRLIFQYATEKMSPDDKERFRRQKKGGH